MQHDMPQPLLVFAVSLPRRLLILGRSVELRTPLEDLFFNFSFLNVYMHIKNKNVSLEITLDKFKKYKWKS